MADTFQIDAIAANLNKAKPIAATPAPDPETPSGGKFTNPFSATGVLDFFGKLGKLGGEVGASAIMKAKENITKPQPSLFQTDESGRLVMDESGKPKINPEGFKATEDLALGFTGAGGGAKLEQKAISFLKKEVNPSVIKSFLSKFGLAEDELAMKSESLAKAKTGNEVRTALGDTIEKLRKSTLEFDDVMKELRGKPTPELQKVVDNLGKKEQLPGKPSVAEPPFPIPAAVSAEDSAVAKLVNAIRSAAPVREDIAAAQTAERGRRAAEVAPIFREGGGEESFNRALGKLRGELTTKSSDFTPVRNELSLDEIKSLFNKVQVSEKLDTFEKISTQQGLRDLLEGNIPQPKQLEHLENVFGHDVIKAIQQQLSRGRKIYNNVIDALNLPRSLITSLDMSAPLRQGIVAGVSHPTSAAKGFKQMFRQVFSEKNFNRWLDDLKSSPDYRQMKEAGLYISDPRDLAGGLSTREESFMSRLAEKIPGLKGSQRAYLSYLNALRVDIFRNLTKTFAEQGANTPKDLSSLAEFINTATGRGSLGKLGRIAPELNATFFSPRLIASRVSLLNPMWYAKQTPAVRKEAIKSMIKFIGAGTTVLSLASLAGAKVETDPRSTDFGKIRIGNTRMDIWGGFQQWIRVISQIISGQKKTTTTGEVQELTAKKFPFTTRFDVAQDFALGKLAPVPSLVVELLKGQQTFGGDLSLTDQAVQNTIPLYLQDISGAYKEMGPAAIPLVGLPSFFGVGVQTFTPADKKSGSVKVSLPSATKTSPVKIHKIKI